MPEYIVRVWVDLAIRAKNPTEAKAKAYNHHFQIPQTEDIEVYDEQVAEVWDRDEQARKDREDAPFTEDPKNYIGENG